MSSASLLHAPFLNLRRNGGKDGSTSSFSIPPLSSRHWLFRPDFTFSGMISNWINQSLRSQEKSSIIGNVASSSEILSKKDEPDHLLVLVHGIMGSPSDWTFVEAELKNRLGRNFLVYGMFIDLFRAPYTYASSSNTYTKTFEGVDRAGHRLADEVMQVVRKTESLKKISFLAHSLGGLFARYAIADLYSEDACRDLTNNNLDLENENLQTENLSRRGMIAGLEPVNFITMASPHLGVRGRKQLPFLLGVPILEKLVPPMAPIFVGQTGEQLFLTDGKPNKAPLLLRMASDSDDGQYISALGSFRHRILYANVSYDYMVGWRTSSIRRETELVKPPVGFLDGYKHVVGVEHCQPIVPKNPNVISRTGKAEEAAKCSLGTPDDTEYYEVMEEEMIRGLQLLDWRKVDVNFQSAMWPFFAHNNIHVKNEWFHNSGVGVVAHLADCLKQQEAHTDLVRSC